MIIAGIAINVVIIGSLLIEGTFSFIPFVAAFEAGIAATLTVLIAVYSFFDGQQGDGQIAAGNKILDSMIQAVSPISAQKIQIVDKRSSGGRRHPAKIVGDKGETF